jgi:hypothetical protein
MQPLACVECAGAGHVAATLPLDRDLKSVSWLHPARFARVGCGFFFAKSRRFISIRRGVLSGFAGDTGFRECPDAATPTYSLVKPCIP